MNPCTRSEMFLAAICDGKTCNLVPATREEMFLAALASDETCELEPATRLELALKKLDEAGGNSGGAEIATCTVRVMPMEEFHADWGTTYPGSIDEGRYVYTKCENGVISTVVHEDYEIGTDYDLTLENVVCGSVIYLNTWADQNTLSGGITEAFQYTGITGLFIAPETPGAVATVTLGWFESNE